ncbi:macro domain-containing protein [Carnobacterium sp. 17-4]|uniref:macro domain-containing protein n=1 Tax=Carnobacterium sp. (strain 17-4) TaxID=208596 RepID=UPI0002E95474|nr:macro domain-containing protein [Carnobacterium sp. 17-4]
MLLYVKQDIFQSQAQVLVNTVNTVGVMGKGIAKRFKDVYPDMYYQYREFCENGLLQTGKLWLYKSQNKWILNFPTKQHWRQPSKINYIEDGLKKFVETYDEKGITSISFPQLGCGNGGLNWEKEVKPLMEKYLKPLPIDIFIHIYDSKNNNVEHMNVEQTLQWLHNSPRNLSIKQLWDDLVIKVKNNNNKLDFDGHWNINVYNEFEDAEHYETFYENDGLEKYIELKNDGYSIKITEDNLLDIWIKLRDYGYLFDYDLPVEFSYNNDTQIVFKLLNLLDYLENIFLLNNNGSETYGLTVRNSNLPISDNFSDGGSLI